MLTKGTSKNPLISIIVPAYNASKYLLRTLDSLKSQTYTNMQIIVVDDGSKDDTFEIAQEQSHKDKRITVLHQENAGVTAARFRGIEAAKGEWIGFADADDIVKRNMYEVLLQNAVNYDADISHCACEYQFSSGKCMKSDDTAEKITKQSNTEALIALLGGNIEPSLWNKLYKCNLLHNLFHSKAMDYTIRENEDLLMNYYLFKDSKSAVHDGRDLYCYMVNADSSSQTNNAVSKALDALKVRKTILLDLKVAKNSSSLYKRALQSYVSCLVRTSEIPRKYFKDKEQYKQVHAELNKVIKSSDICKMNKQLAFQAKFINIWPAGYRGLHKCYSKITGSDKKYSE